MNERKKIPTAVYAEMTPNPSSMKFVADRLLLTGGLQVEYKSKAEAAGSSPLAEELFNFPFVTNVFIAHNFVTVTKDGTIDWDMIVMQLREYIREWLMDNEIAVSTVPAELMSRSASMIEEAKAGQANSSKASRQAARLGNAKQEDNCGQADNKQSHQAKWEQYNKYIK